MDHRELNEGARRERRRARAMSDLKFLFRHREHMFASGHDPEDVGSHIAVEMWLRDIDPEDMVGIFTERIVQEARAVKVHNDAALAAEESNA